MQSVAYFVARLLRAYQIVMIAAAIASWIPQLRGSEFYAVLSMLIDPVVRPVRNLLWRIPDIRTLPIDLSFLAAYLITSAIINLLYII